MAFLTQVDTSTLSNQNISAALLVHTFTNTTRIRKLYVNVFLDQVAGNGAYVCYLTIQRAGAGSAYETIRTTKDAASGITAIVFNSMSISLNATDVMKVYVVGLAGDTTTPDIITDVNEEWINIDASGNLADKTGFAIGTGGIAAAAFAASAIDAAALAADAGTEIANAVKATVIEAQGSYTLQQALSIILSLLAGVTADAGATLKTPNGSATRAVITLNSSNERTAVTLTPSS